jgi:hypothetical protein
MHFGVENITMTKTGGAISVRNENFPGALEVIRDSLKFPEQREFMTNLIQDFIENPHLREEEVKLIYNNNSGLFSYFSLMWRVDGPLTHLTYHKDSAAFTILPPKTIIV